MSGEMEKLFKAKTTDPTDHPTRRPDPSNDRPERGEHLPTMPDPAQNDPETGTMSRRSIPRTRFRRRLMIRGRATGNIR